MQGKSVLDDNVIGGNISGAHCVVRIVNQCIVRGILNKSFLTSLRFTVSLVYMRIFVELKP